MRGLRLLFVRHGESTNNVIQTTHGPQVVSGELSLEDFNKIWYSQRSDDPDLTGKGLAEAEQLASYYSQAFKERGDSVKIYVSSMRRALQTAQPLARSMKCEVLARTDLYEIGGIYTGGQDGQPLELGKTKTASEINAEFGYDVQALPNEGQWYVEGHETMAQAINRANRVAQWLRSESLREESGNSIVVLVMHHGFINLLLQALVRGNAETTTPDTKGSTAGDSNTSRGSSLSFRVNNTSTAALELFAGSVSVSWTNRIDHLGHSAAQAISAL
jgi:broad specificity phosphatase PhoE